MATFDINTSEHIKLTAKLGKLHRSALPVAVRGTLDDASFETKRLLPETAARNFVSRNKSLFRAFSTVNKASGFNIDTMASEVGINPAKGSRVAEGLAKQETGGNIKSRKLIPHDKGRTSGSHEKKLKAKHRFGRIRISEAGKKGKRTNYLLIKKGGGKGTVFEIKGVGKKQKLTPVYSYRSTKISKVDASPFMKPASESASRKIPAFYRARAEKQFKRLLR